ncbi:hypothetical protein [Acetobacter senegalensis]
MKQITKCAHERFDVNVGMARLTKGENGPVTGYVTHVRIKCAECGLPFRFIGLRYDRCHSEPQVSPDATELRAPIEPAYAPEILGVPMVGGLA